MWVLRQYEPTERYPRVTCVLYKGIPTTMFDIVDKTARQYLALSCVSALLGFSSHTLALSSSLFKLSPLAYVSLDIHGHPLRQEDMTGALGSVDDLGADEGLHADQVDTPPEWGF